MKDTTMFDYRYRSVCSCCGDHVSKLDRELPDNDDSEGNLCSSCYGEAQLRAWFEMHDMFDLVEKSLSPINRIKWKYNPDYLKWHHCTKLLNKGILKYQIG